jgi:hypothetical protein
MVLHDWFDWSNAGVGVVGLAFTLWAVRQATGARQAAIEAREAIWQREASDSFSELKGMAEEFAILLQSERSKEALVRARDLLARIPRDRARFGKFLHGDSDKLKELESVFQKLAIRLSSESPLEDLDEAREAIARVFEAIGELNSIYGRLMARLDEVG